MNEQQPNQMPETNQSGPGGMPPPSSQQAPQSNPPPPPSSNNKDGNRVLMGILAYLGPFIIIPYVTTKDDPFVKFHIKQGVVLLVIWIGLWILGMIMAMVTIQLMLLINLLNLGVFVLAIVGIINVVNKKEVELPLVGKFSHFFKF